MIWTEFQVKQHKWDLRFLGLCNFISGWSKDPSTKVGAVIVDRLRRIVSTGYNGLPMGITDTDMLLKDKDRKYATILHGDLNAILFAKRDLTGCTIYTTPFAPCSHCASAIIQSGIARVVAPQHLLGHPWYESVELALKMFEERGIEVNLIPAEVLNAY